MPKYRLLTLEELKGLEQEFINFLIVNGLAADDWEKIKRENPSRTEEMIELFSDMVFERVMSKVEYLECREEKQLKTYQCLSDKIVLVGMSALSEGEANFTDPNYLQKASINPPDSLKVYTTEKSYSKQREVELFEMTESGCTITDGKLFKTLCLSLPNL